MSPAAAWGGTSFWVFAVGEVSVGEPSEAVNPESFYYSTVYKQKSHLSESLVILELTVSFLVICSFQLDFAPLNGMKLYVPSAK